MKKLILLVLSIAMLLSLVACTQPASPAEGGLDNTPATSTKIYQGFGLSNLDRVGPGKDDQDVQVYSFNQVFANVLFDEEGRILDIFIDQLEVATPNAKGEGMPRFSGFPGQGGTEDTEENFMNEVEGWVTKRDRGDDYRLASGTWAEQMDAYQELFKGKTVNEVIKWFNKYASPLNGRPLKDGAKSEFEQGKFDDLNDEEKAMLAELTSSATMSINDDHGNILLAIRNAFDNRVLVESNAIASQGFGLTNTPRVGPGKGKDDTQVYSLNQVFAHTLFDKDGKIAAIYIDQLEVASSNYNGEGMPLFSGFPVQGGNSENNFLEEVASWTTKRDRGEEYKLGTGTWSEQMDKFQEIFVGKSVEEVEEWFTKYTSDLNGRPLKADSQKEEDKAKYDALSDEEKAMLAEVVSSATMSLKDSHGDIIQAIKLSFDNRVEVELNK